MKILKLLFLLAILLAFTVSSFAQNGFSGTVVEVLDGRTVVIELHTKSKITAQLQYVEVPEPGQVFHDVVKTHLEQLVLGKAVLFKPRAITSKNSIVQLFTNGVDVSQQMIRDGAAWHAVLEKSGQDADERKIYESTEKQARGEKRGVWSKENMLTAWEFRAAKEEQEKLEERARLEAIRLANIEKAEKEMKASQKTPEVRNEVNSNLGIWANVSDHDMLVSDLDLFAQGDSPNAMEPLVGQDISKQNSFVATPLSVLSVSYKNDELKLLGTLIYVYQTDGKSATKNAYIIALQSESDVEKFSNARVLTIMADNNKIVSNGAGRAVKKVSNGVQERLQYRISQEDLMKIKNARSLRVSLGNYAGTVKGPFLRKIQVLIAKLQ